MSVSQPYIQCNPGVKRRRHLSAHPANKPSSQPVTYSGFQNPKQEAYYCKLMQKLLQLMQGRLLCFYRNGK